MVRVLILSGFLGSGKTSLILRLGKHFAERLGKRSVIVVNEIGEVGVDGDYLRKLGMNSYEITDGCICCTLRRDLESTLSEVISTFSPDYVLIEPTGIAFPSAIRKVVKKFGLDALVIGVADAKRFLKLYGEAREFIERQLREVEVVAVNKVDEVKSRAELGVLVEMIRQISPNAKIVFTSAKTGEGFDELLKSLDHNVGFEARDDLGDSTREAGASWYSSSFLIKLKKPVAAVGLRNLIVELMEELRDLSGDIQHYKMLLSSQNGVLKLGLTGKDESVSLDGSLAGWVAEAKLNVLLIDKTLNPEQLEKTFINLLNRKSEEFGFEFECASHEHGEKEHEEVDN